jgi:hypothetical protein
MKLGVGIKMNRIKAEKKIRRKSQRLKPCPFCGEIPKVEARCDTEHSKSGSWGHYAVRRGCCKPTGSGQTELFFCNNYKKPDYRLWWRMFCGLVNDWNRRISTNAQ